MTRIAAAVFCLLSIVPIFADSRLRTASGDDSAVAASYVSYALQSIEQGLWDDANRILEAASDFADVSSDASYLLGLVQKNMGRPVASVLESVRIARKTARWNLFSDYDAALIEVQLLLRIRAFNEGLSLLATLPVNADTAYYRLRAYAGLENTVQYLNQLRFILSAYPYDARPLRFYLRQAGRRLPYSGEQALMDRIIRALPVLMQNNPDLAYLAAPFVSDKDYRIRLIAEYRAVQDTDSESLIPALENGLIDESTALRELFSTETHDRTQEPSLDRALLDSVWKLLRHDESRLQFQREISQYSGWIVEDEDGDEYYESRTLYRSGMPLRYLYDADQDGVLELDIAFFDGMPVSADMILYSDPESPAFLKPLQTGNRRTAQLVWERYPYLQSVRVESYTYIPAPNGFPLSPVHFDGLIPGVPDFPVLYPVRDALLPRLSDRALLSFALIVERPGSFAPGSIERIRILESVPLKSEEWHEDRIIAITDYDRGRPFMQYIDMNLDGRMETRRRFRLSDEIHDDPFNINAELEYMESDLNGDGLYEYAEYYNRDGSILKSWDTTGDGHRNYQELTAGE